MYVSAFVWQIRLCLVLCGVVASASTPSSTLRFCDCDMLSSAVRYVNKKTVQSWCESNVRSTAHTAMLIYLQQTVHIRRWVGYHCAHTGSCALCRSSRSTARRRCRVRASHAVRSARSVPNASSLFPVHKPLGIRGTLDTSFTRALNCFCA